MANPYYVGDAERTAEQWKERVQELVSYLSHANKQDHLRTVLDLVNTNAKLASSIQVRESIERENSLIHEGGHDGVYNPMPSKEMLELPRGTREVSIKL